MREGSEADGACDHRASRLRERSVGKTGDGGTGGAAKPLQGMYGMAYAHEQCPVSSASVSVAPQARPSGQCSLPNTRYIGARDTRHMASWTAGSVRQDFRSCTMGLVGGCSKGLRCPFQELPARLATRRIGLGWRTLCTGQSLGACALESAVSPTDH